MQTIPSFSTPADLIAHYDAVKRRIAIGRPKLVALPEPPKPPIGDALPAPQVSIVVEPPPQHDSHCDAFRAHRRMMRATLFERILIATSIHFDLRVEDLIGARRVRKIVQPRQIAFWIAKQVTGRSLPDIGRRMGGKDHTTALHAIRKIDRLRTERPEIEAAIQAILARLQVRL